MDLLRLLRTYLAAVPQAADDRRRACTFVQVDGARCSCRRSTPTSSTTASLTGDTDYIWRVGGLMLGVTFVQVGVRHRRRVLRRPGPRWRFGRDVRDGLFHQVTGFSTQEVDQLRRAVAHHPHHQRRARRCRCSWS